MLERVYKVSERVGSGKDNDPMRVDKWILLFSVDECKNTVSFRQGA